MADEKSIYERWSEERLDPPIPKEWGLDEEDENANYITEVKIYDLLSFIAKATDAEAGIDINYAKNFYLNRDMAKSIFSKRG